MNLNDAMKWLNEYNNEIKDNNIQTCYITKQPIDHEIKLQCSHSFEYYALLNHLMVTQKILNIMFVRIVAQNMIYLYHIMKYIICNIQNHLCLITTI